MIQRKMVTQKRAWTTKKKIKNISDVLEWSYYKIKKTQDWNNEALIWSGTVLLYVFYRKSIKRTEAVISIDTFN